MTLAQKTIADFGEQWTHYSFNDGYYGSSELFEDICGPLLNRVDIENARVVDIGSGTGRIVNMLVKMGAGHIIAVEPSACFPILEQNTLAHAEKITCLNVPGDKLPPYGDVDLVLSIGVLHHIPSPDPVLRAAFAALKPGGKILIWLYGSEGNRLYLALFRPLHALTRHLPHRALSALCAGLEALLSGYIGLCRWLPLPMRSYMRSVLAKFDRRTRRLTIYDQLNPAYAKYYSQGDAADLLARNGFTDIRAYHRHGYSWSVAGVKPVAGLKTENPVSPLKNVALASDAPVIGRGWDFEYDTTREEFAFARSTAGFLYLTHLPAAEEMPRIYPPNYYAYGDSTTEPFLIKRVRDYLESRKVKRYVDLVPRPSAEVLDIGCGDGRLLEIIRTHAPKEWSFHGIEIGENAAHAAGKKGLGAVQGNFEDADLSFWEQRFDLALMHQLIEHLRHPAAALEKARQLLKPGGILSVETPDTGAWDFSLFKKRYWGGYHFPRHFFLFDKASFRQLALENGFEVVSVTSIMSPVFWVHSLHNYCADRAHLARFRRFLKPDNVFLLAAATMVEIVQTKCFGQSSNMQWLLRRVR